MRFYTEKHKHYCGIDLHARSMYLCVLDADGKTLLHRNMPATAEAFLDAIKPFRKALVVAVECIFTWYWLADLCAKEGIAFVLGHALYMRAIHGAKAKNDKIDSHKIAVLLKAGAMPMAYVYPAEMRATRDLLRRRLHFVRERGQLLAHVQNTYHQYNRESPGKRIAYPANRDGLAEGFADRSVTKSVNSDLTLLSSFDDVIHDIEQSALVAARGHDVQSFERLRSVPGIGRVLGLTILYEVNDLTRFPSVQHFASYARLVKCAHESAGKIKGSGGSKMGNAYLKWAFSEAAVLFLAKCADGKKFFGRLERKHGKGKALSVLAHRLGRAAYFMLRRKESFDLERFLKN